MHTPHTPGLIDYLQPKPSYDDMLMRELRKSYPPIYQGFFCNSVRALSPETVAGIMGKRLPVAPRHD